jgi:hypothetical protein
MLRVALLSGGGRRLRIIADRLAEKAEQGDLSVFSRSLIGWTGSPRRPSSATTPNLLNS